MKKLLLGTAAVAMGFAFAAPANAADGVKLGLGGHYKGYLFVQDQDDILTAAGQGEVRSIDALREAEIHFTGETTLDNGLTVGAHFELNADANVTDDFEESYIYASGSWGRINFGSEDGAAYLLQVAAPSADSNYDGIRQYIAPFNYGTTVVNATLAGSDTVYDYAQDQTGFKEKVTYLTPVLNGFQAGLSYTPELGLDTGYSGAFGSNIEDGDITAGVASATGDLGEAYEGAVRYEGAFDQIGFAIGGGYTHIELDEAGTTSVDDDLKAWNVGLDIDFGPFGLGVAYTEDNQATDNDGDRDTLVVGIDYTTGPFKLGASYLNTDEEAGAATDVDTDRYTGGVVYTYGPGMTFRGTLTYVDHDVTGAGDTDGTALMVGTQIDF